MKIHLGFALAATLLAPGAHLNPARAQTAAGRLEKPSPYQWKSVQMVGGGFVDGVVFHPAAKGVRYARTDMGGAYRWDDSAKQWLPILDWVSLADVNLMGVESIAVDPRDPNRVYLACGTYSSSANTAILRSDDGGRTFQRTNVPFRMGGNENGRGDGERLAVDPNDGQILYFGSRQAGLWKSVDRAKTWQHVDTFPDITEAPPQAPSSGAPPAGAGGRRRGGGYGQNRGDGIVFAAFDPRGGRAAETPTRTIYVGVSLTVRSNLFRSTDSGQTWAPVAGEPTQYRPNHGVLAADGNLYVSYGSTPGPQRMRDGGIWKLDTNSGAWTDITPEKPIAPAAAGATPDSPRPQNGQGGFGYGAVSVDAHHPGWLIASTFGRPGGEEIFRSVDAGQTWKPIFHAGGGTYDFSIAPYVARTPIHWLLDIEIDPNDSSHAMFTTGYGGYETFDLTDSDSGKPTHWSVMSKGIEETVALELLSPAQGAHLLTAIGDYGGFVHFDLDKPTAGAYYENPRFGNTTAVAGAAANPAVIVRTGTLAGGGQGTSLGYSLDGGKTWQPAASSPADGSRSGTVAVSADGASWIWTPERGAPAVTRDHGATWAACQGLPAGTRVIADPVSPQTFYAMALFDGKLFVSSDGGANFASQPLTLPGGLPTRGRDRFDARGGQDKIYAAPGRAGDLWLAAYEGLYHSPIAGTDFAKLSGVVNVYAFGFGKAAPGRSDPALYLVGIIDGVYGVFRSDNSGGSWTRINDDDHQWGLILQITGDPRIYGRVYVGTHGRGTLYGDAPGTRN